MEAKRSYNFDVLKILSILMITAFHYVWNASYSWELWQELPRLLIHMLYMLGELGVNCFMLITGYFLIRSGRPFRIKKAVLLWLQVFMYSLLATAVCWKCGLIEINFDMILRTVFPVTFKRWWYASAYLVIYMFTPYLNRLLNSLEQKEYRRLLELLFFLFCAIPTILGVLDNNTERFLFYNRLIWLTVMYCAGAYIGRFHRMGGKKTRNRAGLCFLGIWLFLIIYMVLIEKFSGSLPEFLKINAVYFWGPNTIPMVGLSVSLFLLFSGIHIKGNRLIEHASSSTLGIYLLQGGIFGGVWWKRIFQAPQLEGTWRMFGDLAAAVAVIFILGLGIEAVRKKIEKTWISPFVDRILGVFES